MRTTPVPVLHHPVRRVLSVLALKEAVTKTLSEEPPSGTQCGFRKDQQILKIQ